MQLIANLLFLWAVYGAIRGLLQGRPIIPTELRVDLRTASYDTLSESQQYMVTKDASTGHLEDGHGSDFSSGIHLGGTAAGNLFDEYVGDGTWTMDVQGSSTAGDYSVSEYLSSWQYVRKTDEVTVWGRGSVTVNSAGSGTIQITGLPFSCRTNTTANGTLRLVGVSDAEDIANMYTNIVSGNSFCTVNGINNDGTETTIDVSQLAPNGDIIQITLTYPI